MRRTAMLVLAAAFIFAALVLPNHPGTMQWSALKRWPLELPVLLLGAMAVGRRLGITYALALLLLTAVVIKIADYAMFSALNRTFNPVLDTFLIGAGFSLLRDSVGNGLAIMGVIGAVVLLVLVFFLLERSLRVWASVSPTRPWRATAAVLALFGAGWA
ncbi:MAG: sulfatase-like protein, partial [Roseobacter sp.]|nr:sulfatase-like protein [Roseobacter sp.]